MTLRKFVYHDPTGGFLDDQDAADSISLGDLTVDGSGAGSGTITLTGGGTLTGLPTTPSGATEAASKSYVDGLVSGIVWKENVSVMEMISDADQSGVDPTPVAAGETWVVNNWSTETDGDIVEWSGSAWVTIVANSGGEPPDGTRVVVTDGTAAGSFAGEEGEIATYDATGNTWSFEDPADGWAVLVTGEASVNENTAWTWDSSAWIQFTGAGAINAGAGLDKTGNTIFVGNGDGIKVNADTLEVELSASTPGLELTGSSPNKTLQVLLDGAHGIIRGSSGIEIEIDDTPDTLDVDGDGLKVVGLPSLFKVNGTAVGSTVTAANLDTLTDGSSGVTLHTHTPPAEVEAADRIEDTHVNQATVTTGFAVRWGSVNNNILMADAVLAVNARAIGVARIGGAIDPGTSEVVKHGLCVGCLTPHADTFAVNSEAFLGIAGALRLFANIPKPGRIIRMGYAANAADLDVQVMDLGRARA